MKNIKAMVLSSLFTLSFGTMTWAVPGACPSVDAIKKGGFMAVQEYKKENVYIVYQLSKYDTPEIWAFGVGIPINQVTSKDDAKNKAQQALDTLDGSPKPIATDQKNNRWYCLYENKYNYITGAVTPMVFGNQIMDPVINAKAKATA